MVTIFARNNLGQVTEARGLSSDEKPSNASNGCAFVEMDTGTVVFFDADGNQWHEWAV